MNKKLIALLLVLPMALMMTLFTAVNTVSLKVDIHVSKVEVLGEEFVSLDLDKNERYFVDYVVYPTMAVNKKVNFSFERVGTQDLAGLEYKDGYIYPKSAGVANVCITTQDGGFRDKFQVVVKSKVLKSIECSVENDSLIIGNETQILTEFFPKTANNKALKYSSNDEDVATVSTSGLITAVGKGSALITVTSLANENISDTIEIIVSTEDILDITPKNTTVSAKEGTINLSVDTLEEYTLSYEVISSHDAQVIKPKLEENPFIETGEGNFKFNYEFNEDFYGPVEIRFTILTETRSLSKTCSIERIKDFSVSFNSEQDLFLESGNIIDWKEYITYSPNDAKIEISAEYSNNNVEKYFGLSDLLEAKKLGLTTATLTVKNLDREEQVQILTKQIYVYSEDVYIKEAKKVYGIEKNIWTIGSKDVSGNAIQHALTLGYGNDVIGENFDSVKEKLYFETSEKDKVAVDNNGVIKILDNSFNDVVEIALKINLQEEKVLDTIKVRCLSNGVEVDNFIDLHKATNGSMVVVLQGDIIDDFGKDELGNDFYTGENITKNKIESTYDTTYYKNVNNTDTQVITLLQFRASLYGNGHVIDANNVTYKTTEDRYDGKALFMGPLNFVSVSDTGSEKLATSVKAQDNICFAVYENTTINNVELKGCTSCSDLTQLDYMGTVVEVLGDNVNIEYSRINNGRTVLRVFGDVEDKEKVINLTVKNSVLSCAREFVIRIGTNLFVNSTEQSVEGFTSPYLDENTSIKFPAQKYYSGLSETKKSQYEESYIKTFVNIQNSVLMDSGIFSIALDTHFSGPMLLDASQVFNAEGLSGWKNMASTSYGAKLTFEGDVRIYDWKEVDKVNSSTLIENANESLSFDVKEMISKLGNKPLVYNYNGKQYVHGGIVFFGGGKNYSVFEDNSESFKGLLGDTAPEFTNYEITLSEVDKKLLELAAGSEPFYFTLYDANSKFNYAIQQTILSGDSATDCIYK